MLTSKLAIYTSSLALVGIPSAALGESLKTDLNLTDGSEAELKHIVKECENNTDQPYCTLSCVYSDVICVNETGTPLPSEVVPETVDPNTTLRIVVISKGSFPKLTVTETVNDISYPRLSKALTKMRDVNGGWSASTVAYTMNQDAKTIRLDFSENDTTTSTLVIRSSGGYYFVSVGAGLIIPMSGAPRIAALNPPDGSGARFEVMRDSKLRPALMLRVYPFGHRAQSLSSFAGPLPPNRTILRRLGTVARDLLSIEAGINLEPSIMTERLLVGLGLEPVTGFSFSWGIRFEQAERFRNGFSNGAFVTANRADAVESYLSVGQYLGVSINQYIFDLVSRGYSGFQGQSQSP